MEKPLNIAHRGGAGLWPENTLFALAEAARAGFDGAEIDVQLTRDRQLAVFHDFHLKPALCRGPNGKWLTRRRGPLPLICDSDYAELSQFDVGRVRANSAYGLHHKPLHQRDGERIPLLSEAIATVRSAHKSFRLFIEIKTSYQNRALSAAARSGRRSRGRGVAARAIDRSCGACGIRLGGAHPRETAGAQTFLLVHNTTTAPNEPRSLGRRIQSGKIRGLNTRSHSRSRRRRVVLLAPAGIAARGR